MILLGCIADDITGATDLAGAIVRAGLSTSLIFDVPSADFRLAGDCDAVVIALKSRTIPPSKAIEQSLRGLRWLESQEASRVYFKYCSTFDSTPKGNIGPVSDALMTNMGATLTVHAPGYPANQRTVYMGHLFLGDRLLSESGMRNHPLTPMRDSNLVRVLSAQTPQQVGLLQLTSIKNGADSVARELTRLKDSGVGHVIADTVEAMNLEVLANAVSDDSLAAGGAAFGASLAGQLAQQAHRVGPPHFSAPMGAHAVLVGSASEASTRQVAAFARDWPVYRLSTDQVRASPEDISAIMAWAAPRLQKGPILITADTSSGGVTGTTDRYGRENAAGFIESTMGRLAICLSEVNVGSLIVAGGETSGAVAEALKLATVEVGVEICPGVPWTYSREHRMAIAFKSGNFGGDSFFTSAFDVLHHQPGSDSRE